jgi:23S rRNA (guanine2535-N1)-methyltransferase
MQYLFPEHSLSKADLASGKVLFSRPGLTAFPVRLGNELFLRAVALLEAAGRRPPYHVYDPTCGGGYLMTVLGLLNPQSIARLSMSDISPEALSIAAKNVNLLSAEGMLDRQAELAALAKVSERESHAAATASAASLHAWLDRQSSALQQTSIFKADATDPDGIRTHFPANPAIDIGFADAPYELHSTWRTEATGSTAPEMKVLATFAELSVPVVILATRKGLKLTNPGYRRAAKLKNGHRVLWIFELAG